MELKTSAGALNITIGNHLPTEYKKLFESAFALKNKLTLGEQLGACSVLSQR
nr:hypothetical protein [Ningiella sp. W23]